ncbi:hypothetical protein LTS16_022237 [Friedmanniomyces endolithicus]|uniref:HIT-type domain-containing protein n=1 Tax=Friedmanniomyces endolithicus TaxID=329885 RepID=A0AAN6J7J0_9PEZI|nr:hypothetical protein LTR35_002174 [Friedmanniomyces endolithicus]KAK0299783.1 hypothetical protein LTS00_001553 [Friedmanniomyces endolithicus]KAK0319260.1 hypothetical protein LTR82_009677 [Friedmanniomyces endolithicus]KAK0921767.1 hypothetical protein LTR57_008351 [Friedmanniomyces endolithicus]KAK1002672.1 hypothetical protein LTR54_008064 [Friedmanniomyces endolithicus]
MATGPLRFRTPHIEELPIAQSRQSAGFAWVAVSTAHDDPAKNWGTTNRKRARASLGGQTEQQKEALSARVQRETERKIKELNSDNSRDVVIDIAKKPGSSTGGAFKAGKTTGTKKILASGKTFAHYLDDEEAEIARTGRRDGDADAPAAAQRASKTPLARRKPRADSSASHSPAPSAGPMAPPPIPRLQTNDSSVAPIPLDGLDDDDDEEEDSEDPLPRMPTAAEMEALLNAPPLTYNQARSAPPPAGLPPPRRFCDTCGYWGRVRCMKCGAMTCSVVLEDVRLSGSRKVFVRWQALGAYSALAYHDFTGSIWTIVNMRITKYVWTQYVQEEPTETVFPHNEDRRHDRALPEGLSPG